MLIDQGELTVNEGKDLIEKLLAQSKGEEPEPQVNEPMVSTRELEQYLAEHKLPTREDIKKLLAELEALENRLDQMEK